MISAIVLFFFASLSFCSDQKTALIVYFSYTNNTAILVDKLAKELEDNSNGSLKVVVDRLMPTKPVPKKTKMCWDSVLNRDDFGLQGKEDPSKYENVFVGTPVWFWTTATPMVHWAGRTNFNRENGKFFLFNQAGGMGNERAFKKLAKTMKVEPTCRTGFIQGQKDMDFLISQFANNCLVKMGITPGRGQQPEMSFASTQTPDL